VPSVWLCVKVGNKESFVLRTTVYGPSAKLLGMVIVAFTRVVVPGVRDGDEGLNVQVSAGLLAQPRVIVELYPDDGVSRKLKLTDPPGVASFGCDTLERA